MIPLFLFFPWWGRNMDLSDGVEFMDYAKKPKKRSISGFLILSIPLGLMVFVVCQTITVHTCSNDLALKILDWEQNYFWATLLIAFGMGLIANSIGWTIFMIQKRHPKHTGITQPGVLPGFFGMHIIFKNSLLYIYSEHSDFIFFFFLMKKFIIPFLLLSIMFAGCTSKPGGVAPSPIAQACTEEAKLCPDGSAVGRTGPNCEFAPCSTETGSTTGILHPQACTMEAKLCPDGSSVGRSGPNCDFAPCSGEVQAPCVPICACPAGYRQEGQGCNPECYYSTPKCLMPSRQCEPTNNCVQNK